MGPSYGFRYHEIIVILLYVVSCLCMVFLLGLGSCLLHVQVRERKRWSPELESLRGGVYMDDWPARCGDRIGRGFIYLSVRVVACATSTFVRVMVFNSMVLFYVLRVGCS